MVWYGRRNEMDYLLTDILPVELSESFSFCPFYNFLLQKKNIKIFNDIKRELICTKSKGQIALLQSNWSSVPLKYKIMKGNDTERVMSVIQPLGALSLLYFVFLYESEILTYFKCNHIFSIRYHKRNPNLYYLKRDNSKEMKKQIEYFQSVRNIGVNIIQQTGQFYKIGPFDSINSFCGSQWWRFANFQYKYYLKLDYKACFDSIYSHTFNWLLMPNVDDAKKGNPSLFNTIDRELQNINGRVTNGIVVGPEFSRMAAEILLQHVDEMVASKLSLLGLTAYLDYKVFRYVDDIFVFANDQNILDNIYTSYKDYASRFHLQINELKLEKGETPFIRKPWLQKTRALCDMLVDNLFTKGKESDCIISHAYMNIERLKDEITLLIKDNNSEKRTIVSFLLSTLLNNISKRQRGKSLFGKETQDVTRKIKRSIRVMDMAFFIYAFFPSFEQTRKLISLISYMNEEIDYRKSEVARKCLQRVVHDYNFIFRDKNLPDLVDWFRFFQEYEVVLDRITEDFILGKIVKDWNPIIAADYLLYSQYDQRYFQSVQNEIFTHVSDHLEQLKYSEDVLMNKEFWDVIVFHNCPYLDVKLKKCMGECIEKVSDLNENAPKYLSDKIRILIKKYMEDGIVNTLKYGFFKWNKDKNFAKRITYRTYQRTLFRKKRRKAYVVFGSFD